MPFEKGHKHSVGRGQNRINKEVKEAYAKLLHSNLESLEQDLAMCKPEKRVELMLKLSEYILPKLKSVEAKVETSGNVPNWLIDVTDAEIEQAVRLDVAKKQLPEAEDDSKIDEVEQLEIYYNHPPL